ncbi:MAG: hypothetical protein H7Y18_19490 [Clostridiaceae bacterium]|nr:hypothetical protein [Clostridiaceae bacterium]
MEFKLNKIDPELRARINASTKEGKIHKQDSHLDVNKDRADGEKNKKSYSSNEQKSGNTLFVEAIKIKDINIEVFVDSDDEKRFSKGIILDIKR